MEIFNGIFTFENPAVAFYIKKDQELQDIWPCSIFIYLINVCI